MIHDVLIQTVEEGQYGTQQNGLRDTRSFIHCTWQKRLGICDRGEGPCGEKMSLDYSNGCYLIISLKKQ